MAIRKFLQRLRRNTAAVAMTEFAMAAPLILTVSLYGLEMANYAITQMRISQVAMHIADNGSRIGDQATLTNRKIYEADINDLLVGSNLQAGEGIDLYTYGRVIVSSLETQSLSGNPGQQWIHWQRCKGKFEWTSSYGEEGAGDGDPSFRGMGPAGQQVAALPDEAVIFVEIAYNYQPIVTDAFLPNRTIQTVASFIVRDDRDLSQIYQVNPDSPDAAASCSTFDSYSPTPTLEASPAGGWKWYD